MITYKPEWNPKIPIIEGMIHTLYDQPCCSCGGLCHIVTDDDNIRDEDLKFVIEYCEREENASRPDKELSSWICQLLLQLTFEQRAGLFGMMEADIDIDENTWEYIEEFDNIQLYIEEQMRKLNL